MEHNVFSPEAIQAQKELLGVQESLNRSVAEANRSAVELNRSQLELVQANAQMQAALSEEVKQAQLDLQKEEQARLRDFQNKQLGNIQTTFDILFSQTKWAAIMFYVSFWLGVALVVSSVILYVVLRDPNNLLTLAFFGAGALAMLSFFIRDPAEKIQKTAGKLVQTQAAMRYHLMEITYWDAYLLQKMKSSDPLKGEELTLALKSILAGTQAMMRQIDESLDDKTATITKSKEDELRS